MEYIFHKLCSKNWDTHPNRIKVKPIWRFESSGMWCHLFELAAPDIAKECIVFSYRANSPVRLTFKMKTLWLCEMWEVTRLVTWCHIMEDFRFQNCTEFKKFDGHYGNEELF